MRTRALSFTERGLRIESRLTCAVGPFVSTLIAEFSTHGLLKPLIVVACRPTRAVPAEMPSVTTTFSSIGHWILHRVKVTRRKQSVRFSVRKRNNYYENTRIFLSGKCMYFIYATSSRNSQIRLAASDETHKQDTSALSSRSLDLDCNRL